MPGDKSEAAAVAHAAVLSPCIGVCQLDPQTGWCSGCYRSIAEIASWPRLEPAERRRLMAALQQRRASP